MKLRRKAIGGVNFRRQHPLYGFIVDFCCPERKLIIELDGADHAEADPINYDARRTALLESKGYRVLRFGILTCWRIWKGCLRRYTAR